MYYYRQTIILFGIVIPLIVAAAVVGVGSMIKSKMTDLYVTKEGNFKTYEQSRIAALEIEAKVGRDRHHLDRWNSLLSQETASSITSNLREISDGPTSKEIQQTSFERPSTTGGFGSVSAHGSSEIRMAFRGTFRTLQSTFLKLETRMPQLQLHELRMEPNPTSPSLVNLQVTYTAWENRSAGTTSKPTPNHRALH